LGHLVATDQDQQCIVDDVLEVDVLAVGPALDEQAHEIVAGGASTVLDRSRSELAESAIRLCRGQHRFRIGVADQRAQHVVGPLEQRGALGLGKAEHVADHVHRQPGREIPDRVALAALADVVDDALAPGVDRVDGLGQPTRGEAAVDHVAAPLVLRAVLVDHHRDCRVVRSDPAAVAEQIRVQGDVLEIGVDGDAPHLTVPIDRRVLAQPSQLVMRVSTPELPADEIHRWIGRVVTLG
jgi:hypothetical protein